MNKKNKAIIISVGLLAVLLGFLIYKSYFPTKPGSSVTKYTIESNPNKNNGEIFYPISRYEERLTVRRFGQKVGESDKTKCGQTFVGIHNADDLEVFGNEINQEVPVYATSEGKIVFKNYIDGYGGLIILQTILDNKDLLINYGHIDISTAKVNLNDQVNAGMLIGFLGDDCSSETDGERKHLHFGIHKGTTVDVRGYLPRESDLEEWLDPKKILAELSAQTL